MASSLILEIQGNIPGFLVVVNLLKTTYFKCSAVRYILMSFVNDIVCLLLTIAVSLLCFVG
jgi:hypothetical protein